MSSGDLSPKIGDKSILDIEAYSLETGLPEVRFQVSFNIDGPNSQDDYEMKQT